MRRTFSLLLLDLLIVALATVGALLLRDNFELWLVRLRDLAPYLAISLVVFSVVAPILGLNRAIWRLTTTRDIGNVLLGVLLTVLGSLAVCFLVNRLEGVSRGLPAIQGLLMAAALSGLRVAARERHLRRGQRGGAPGWVDSTAGQARETIIVVGLNRITELYLQSVAEFAAGSVAVAGLLGRHEKHTGRLVHQHKILGLPEDIAIVLRELEVRGVIVDRIVVTQPPDQLSEVARTALLDIEQTSSITLEFVSEWVTGRGNSGTPAQATSALDDKRGAMFVVSQPEAEAIARRPYWRVKRLLDIVAAVTLIVLTLPLQVALVLVVAASIGFPFLFWQQRPGRGGRPFRLYKFRSMGASHDASGRRKADAERITIVGWALRRSRLDELPQLYNILAGHMSFVGPRPLLPVDQPIGFSSRLLVRPGLTGWAQIMGGRYVGAEDKVALDLWYLRNASLVLDLRILLRTVPMLVTGEQVNAASIATAWSELAAARVFGQELCGQPATTAGGELTSQRLRA